jgi:hypothetical protein
MAERDPQFEQDVRRIIYEALADREALAAAMARQQPTPVPDATPGQPADPAPSRPGPWETGVQGGALGGDPPPQRVKTGICTHDKHIDVEDMYYDELDAEIDSIAQDLGEPRARVIQELQRRALKQYVPGLRADINKLLGK